MSKVPKQFTAPQVRQWFKDAIGTRKIPLPDENQCAAIARQLPHAFAVVGTPKGSGPLSPEAVKYGRLFLQHLAGAEQPFEQILSANFVPEALASEARQMLSDIASAKEYVGRVLGLAEFNRTGNWDWREAAVSIYLLAATAWLDAGKWPKSVNDGDPMCEFVTVALASGGHAISRSRVAEVLKESRAAEREILEGENCSRNSP